MLFRVDLDGCFVNLCQGFFDVKECEINSGISWACGVAFVAGSSNVLGTVEGAAIKACAEG